MLLLGIEPDEAFRLSFTAGIFAAAGAFGLTLLTSKSYISAAISGIGPIGLAVAIITSTIISLFLIDFLIKFAGKQKITYLIAALGIIADRQRVTVFDFRSLDVHSSPFRHLRKH